MSSFIIHGGRTLNGHIDVHGAKNSVLPILAATLVCNGECVIHNCPNLKDVDSSIRILRHLGCRADWKNGSVVIDSSTMDRYDIPDCLMREMRSSVVFLGAILARCKQAVMSFPGGCELGPRPIDMHLSGLRDLQIAISEENGNIICVTDGIIGTEINLAFPSVGATENIMLAACLGNGITTIYNAACEPEIEDLQNFLIACGAKVAGAGTSTIYIDGVEKLSPTEHSIIPDRIVTATLMSAVAIAGGNVVIGKTIPGHVSTIETIFEQAGCEIIASESEIKIVSKKKLKAVNTIRTMPYPGFPTDAQSPIMAAVTKAVGTTVFIENIFDSRFRHVDELARMGANIKTNGRVAVVTGQKRLHGARVAATDLRGGAALVVAALAAEGETQLTALEHIDRGYEKMEDMLSSLGASIVRVNNAN